MTAMQLLGLAFCSLPFIVITVCMVKQGGWRVASMVWLLVGAIVSSIYLGVSLMASS